MALEETDNGSVFHAFARYELARIDIHKVLYWYSINKNMDITDNGSLIPREV
jgi:hypothetical protein